MLVFQCFVCKQKFGQNVLLSVFVGVFVCITRKYVKLPCFGKYLKLTCFEEAFVGYVEEGNIRPSTESCLFNEGQVCCVGVTEMPSRQPGWHFSISDKQKMLFFWFNFKHFFLKKFRGKLIFECSYS